MRTALVATVIFLCSLSCSHAPAQSPSTIKVLIRADGTKGLSLNDLHVETDGAPCEIRSIQRVGTASGAPLEVAVLIDDAIRLSLQQQEPAFQEAVAGLASPRVAVGVGFMREDKFTLPGGFSTQAERVLKVASARMEHIALNSSLDVILSNIARTWPIHPTAARVILLISPATLNANGSSGRSLMEHNKTLAEEDLQRARIPMYSIYAGSSNLVEEGTAFAFLDEVASSTGGTLLNATGSWLGGSSVNTWINQFKADLENSYVIEFQADGKAGLSKLKITSQAKGIKIYAPKAVLTP